MWKRRLTACVMALAGALAALAEPRSLVDAVSLDDAGRVRELLSSGSDVNERDSDGRTALMIAVHRKELAPLLLSAGADVNAVDDYGRSALDHAAMGPWIGVSDPEMLRLLLAAGADPNGGPRDMSPLWPVAAVGPLESVWVLVEAGADPSARSAVPEFGLATEVGAVGAAQFFDQPEIVRYLVSKGALRAVPNNSNVRVRDRPTTEGSAVITMLQKGEQVTVLGRGETEAQVGDVSGYWLRVRLEDGRVGYSYGEFFDLDVLHRYDIPVFHGSATDPSDAIELLGNGALYRAEHSRGALGADAASPTVEEIRFERDGSLSFSSSSATVDGVTVRRCGGTWVTDAGWVMLRLEQDRGEQDMAQDSPEAQARFLEWRSDLQGFLWSEDATRIDREGYRLNAPEGRFERETEGQYDHIGYFTPVWVK